MRQRRATHIYWTIGSIVLSSMLHADISGAVFKDFDMNGKFDTTDAPLVGAEVAAYCNDGKRYVTTTDKEGKYTLSGFPAGSKCRVEVNASAAGFGSGSNAEGGAPLVDFVADGQTHDVSVGSPATYCQDSPDVAAAAVPGWFTDDEDERVSPNGFGTLFTVPIPPDGTYNANDTIDDKRQTLTVHEQTGAIWGLAWKRSTSELFASAVIRRYVPLKDETIDPKTAAGSIYKIDLNGNVERFAVVPDTISDDDVNIIKSRTYGENEDTDIKELVGTRGLGDIDITEDDRYLYTVNLYKKELVKIDTSNGNIVESVAIPNPYGADCDAQMVRPWAVKVRGNDVYIGSVCEDQILDGDDPTDMSAGGLGAVVQKYDGNGFSTVAQTNTLRYLRPRGYDPTRETNYQYQNTDWSHGSYEWLPQPILTDIEFANNGDLVLGYTDRSVMIRERYNSHGDIRKMCLNPDGTYTDESTERVQTDCPSHEVKYKDNDDVYYEFYVGDYYGGTLGEDGHPETASGALAQAPGHDNIIVGMVDGTDWYQPGSIGHYSHTTGDKIAAQALIDNRKTVDGGEREPYASKAGGMGDVELLCDPAPIEIGDLVWLDLNENGIQDGGEPPIADVNVTLSCNGEQYGKAKTDASGHFYFGGPLNANLENGKSLKPGDACEMTLPKSEVDDKAPTVKDPNNNADDIRDNDAEDNGDGNNIIKNITLDVYNNHTFDFGITPAFGCVSGQLYNDVNENGNFDATDETAPAGITLYLKDKYGNEVQTVTDDDGKFSFDHILTGDVTVRIDTTDTDIPEGAVWSVDMREVDVEEGTAPDCTQSDFAYTVPSSEDQDPADIATCANPTSVTWDGASVSTATVWETPEVGKSLTFTTEGGETVDVTMRIVNDNDGEYNRDSSGTSAAFGTPYFTMYLGDQESPGDGNWSNSDGAGCGAHGYDLEAGESYQLEVTFSEPVVLDNWRIRDVDSGDKRADESDWEWQDGIKVEGYDAEGNPVDIETKIGSSGEGLIVDGEGIVHTDKENYDAGGGDFATGAGTTPDSTNGHIVLTSNFVPVSKIVITHQAGPDMPCQTRSALALAGFAVCKPLHLSGTVYDDADGAETSGCTTSDGVVNGEPVSEVNGTALQVCLLDAENVVTDVQLLTDGTFDFDTGIRPETEYKLLLTTQKCEKGKSAPVAQLPEGWEFEGEQIDPENHPGHDGTKDGMLSVSVGTDSVEDIAFGINKRPQASGYERPSELNPGDTNSVVFDLSGAGAEQYLFDEEGTPTHIEITKISGGTLYYDGSEVAAGDRIDNPDFAKFTVDPKDGDVVASFGFVAVDDACLRSNEALFKAPFTTLNISGSVVLDKTRDAEVTGEPVAEACDSGKELYASLLDANGNLLSSVPVNAEDGTFAFHYADGVRADTSYRIVLSTIEGATDASLPDGCMFADGERVADTKDEKADGTIDVSVERSDLSGIVFGITPTVKVGDLVWIENDNDGDATTGDITPVTDTTVHLECNDGTFTRDTQTDDNGRYLFDVPVNSTCTASVPLPENTVPATGSDDNDVPADGSENGKTHDYRGTTVHVGEQDNLSVDFGFANVGDICGSVTEDTDGDGKGDRPIADVTLELYDADGSRVRTMTTEDDGTYCFLNVVPGRYVVKEIQPAGYLDVSENEGGDDNDANEEEPNAVGVVLQAGEKDTGNDFVEEKPGSVCGHVYADTDNDGKADTPMSDVTLKLEDQNGNYLASTVTDKAGAYCFDNLRPAVYGIAEVQPEGYLNVSQNDGGDDNDHAYVKADYIKATVDAGEKDGGNDFVEIEAGSLCGSVTEDTDNDDNGDVPIEGVTLTLYDAAENKLATALTDSGGNYCFVSLYPGVYRVDESQPEGYLDVSENEGGADRDAKDNDKVNSIGAVVNPGERDEGNDFVEEKPAKICGYTKVDTDNDDEGESAASGVTVQLFNAQGDLVTETTTEEDGGYCFAALRPGAYRVGIVVPEGYTEVVPAEAKNDDADDEEVIDASAGSRIDGIDFLIEDKAHAYRIGNLFWIDGNGNGKYDNGEKTVAGALVELLDVNGTILATTTTDSEGHYHFDVPEGSYTVRFHIPETLQREGYDFVDTTGTGDDTNKANGVGVVETPVTVGPKSIVKDLTVDAAVSCGCENVTSDSASSANIWSILFGLMGMFAVAWMQAGRKEETE